MNNNSKVLALKYRPQTFDDLIGQEVVAETITNSIKADKIPNAYLFTGIRGIGKTTTARIVAKALNCSNGIDNLCEENFCDIERDGRYLYGDPSHFSHYGQSTIVVPLLRRALQSN